MARHRRLPFVLGAAAIVVIAAYVVVPTLIERRLRAELVDAGFPDARLEIASIGLHHLQLRDVHLQQGVDIASVRVGGGKLAINDARVSVDSLVELGTTLAKMTRSGTSSGALAVSITARDPKAGWSVAGKGHVSWGRGVAFDGEIALDMPHFKAGPFELTNLHVPVSIDTTGITIEDAHANVAGGTVRLDAELPVTGAATIGLQARGVRMAELLAPTRRLTGTGLVDGELALARGKQGWTVERGEVHARAPGTLKVTDAEWRAKVAETSNSRVAVHRQVASALMDFQYDTLTAELAAPGVGPEVRVATRGRGRMNQQELDIAINVRGLLGGIR